MSDQEIMVLGFQASGKTTFAAALWHLVGSREISDTALVMGKHNGDFRYLDEISAAWAGGWVVGRTLSEEWRPIAINLRRVVPETDIKLSFVDIAGETVERIFVTREVDERVEPLIRGASGLLLFESPRVCWRGLCSNVTQLFDLGSSFHRKPPLLLGAGHIRWHCAAVLSCTS